MVRSHQKHLRWIQVNFKIFKRKLKITDFKLLPQQYLRCNI